MSFFDNFSNKLGGEFAAAKSKVTGFISETESRLKNAGLRQGGFLEAAVKGAPATPRFANENADWRVKISLAKDAKYFYKDDSNTILAPIRATDGVIFPFTPQIQVSHTARYANNALAHSNYTNYSYEGSEVAAITITGDFAAQTNSEAMYVLACIQFFRSATKMWWGNDSNAGNPPPIVFLSGYGDHYLPNVPCVITTFQHTMPQEVDYISAQYTDQQTIQISTTTPGGSTSGMLDPMQRAQLKLQNTANNGKPGESAMSNAMAYASRGMSSPTSVMTSKSYSTMVPTLSSMSVTLQPVYSRKRVGEFSLDKFAAGKMLGNKKDGTGGFI